MNLWRAIVAAEDSGNTMIYRRVTPWHYQGIRTTFVMGEQNADDWEVVDSSGNYKKTKP